MLKLTNQDAIVNSFNNYFVSIADKITENLKRNMADQDSITNSVNLMNKSATNLCPAINWSYTSTADEENYKIPKK
jgi:hypothetical protein